MRTATGTSVVEHVITFPRQLRAAPEAREFVRRAVAGHVAAQDTVLVAAELMANSLAHACDATVVTLAVAVGETLIRVEVRDDGTSGIPHMRRDDMNAEDGRGFRLVNQLARRWGFTRDPAGSCCWAEITSPGT